MRLAVARIGRPHGVKGEVTVEVLTDAPEDRFIPGVTLECDSDLHPSLELSRVRIHQERWLLTFKEITERNEAERVRNARLYADVSIEDGDEPDSYHVQALLGMEVVALDDQSIGRVIDVQSLPGQDLLEVETKQGGRLIPMVHQFIISIDTEERRIRVSLPEGLLD